MLLSTSLHFFRFDEMQTQKRILQIIVEDTAVTLGSHASELLSNSHYFTWSGDDILLTEANANVIQVPECFVSSVELVSVSYSSPPSLQAGIWVKGHSK